MICEWCHRATARPHLHPLDCVRGLEADNRQLVRELGKANEDMQLLRSELRAANHEVGRLAVLLAGYTVLADGGR